MSPFGTVTLAGTVTPARSDDNVTLRPPVGATALIVAVPVIVVLPPYDGFGATVRLLSVCADNRHGTNKATKNSRNLIGDPMVTRRFDV